MSNKDAGQQYLMIPCDLLKSGMNNNEGAIGKYIVMSIGQSMLEVRLPSSDLYL